MIDISGLRMLIVCPRNVPDICFFAEFAELVSPAIIEYIDMQLVLRVVDIHGGKRRRPHNRQGLVISRNQQIDMRPVLKPSGHRIWWPMEWAYRLNVAEEENGECVKLSQKKNKNKDDIDRP